MSSVRAATGATVSSAAVAGDEAFLEDLTETSLYSIGASFCDRTPELVDELLEQGAAIEAAGLRAWAQAEGVELEAAFRTLMTGLAVRYYTAVAGAG